MLFMYLLLTLLSISGLNNRYTKWFISIKPRGKKHILATSVQAQSNKPFESWNSCESLLSVCTDLEEFVAVLWRVKHLFYPLPGVRETSSSQPVLQAKNTARRKLLSLYNGNHYCYHCNHNSYIYKSLLFY